jgi:hypothetical protein
MTFRSILNNQYILTIVYKSCYLIVILKIRFRDLFLVSHVIATQKK